MIAVDSSALIEVVARQRLAAECAHALLSDEVVMSAATLTASYIVAARKNATDELSRLLAVIEPEIEDVTAAFALRAADAYRRWGKGFHRADLNYGDSFSYALAEMYGCPLLYVGNDFAQTDIRSALAGEAG